MRRTTLFTLEATITGGLMTDEFVARNPVISRTIEIRADQTLNQLHRTIFEAFGRWDDCHLSEFNMGGGVHDKGGDRYVLQFIYDDPAEVEFFDGGRPTGSMERTRIGKLELQPGRVFWYWYDFGDDWVHRITVVGIGEAEPGVKYPRVVTSVGESPPQYRDWDDHGSDDVDDVGIAAMDWAAELLGSPKMDDEVATGVTELDDGSKAEWTHERLSNEEASVIRERHAGRTYRVTALRELLNGESTVSTYLVPGTWLEPWLHAIEVGSGGQAAVLGVEVV